MKTADYTSQNVSLGSLHFLAIDMGGGIPLNLRMRQAMGAGNPREINQRVIKHLAL